MAAYSLARLEEIDEISDGRVPWRPLRHHLGIRSFGINAFTAPNAGDRLINEHHEAEEGDMQQEELYLVYQGHARFELDGETVDAPARTLVYVPPEVTRTAFAEEPNTTLLAVGGTPGEAYFVFGWELWRTLQPLFEAGEYEEVAERGRELVEANPDLPMPFYNLACAEAKLGRREDAIEHLRRAVELFDGFREYAAGDSDFDSIREDPEFQRLLAAG
jgi:tetratricopeptide (TPR) repeat protein